MNVENQKPLRIIQISDCHVAADRSADYRGQNADDNLAAIVQVARQWKPQLVMVTGDVSEDGSADSYVRTAALLAQIGVPTLALPGNHDDADRMRQYFPLGPWNGPFLFRQNTWQLILLDSSRAGQISGSLESSQLEQMQQALQDPDASHCLLALHHQPVAVEAPWIDRYGLEMPESFFRIIDQAENVRCITWGHVHQDFRMERKGVDLFGTPSSAANSLPATEKFSLDPAGPACRWFQLSANGLVETGILRVGR